MDHNKLLKHDFALSNELYDVPKAINSSATNPITPSSSNSSIRTMENVNVISPKTTWPSFSSDYDIPKRITVNNSDRLYDIPQSKLSNKEINTYPPEVVEYPNLSTALEALTEVQMNFTAAVSKLLSFATSDWRNSVYSDRDVSDLRSSISTLSTFLRQILNYCNSALSNAHKADEKSLVFKLQPLLKALYEANILFNQNVDINTVKKNYFIDFIDKIIKCAQTLTEIVREACAIIQGNAAILFKKVQRTTEESSERMNTMEYYDYISLEYKDTSISPCNNNSNIGHKNTYIPVIAGTEPCDIMNSVENICSEDMSLIQYYVFEVVQNIENLTQAVDAFLLTVEHNQPPKFFLAYGKIVILYAHNLVNIGDILHRNVTLRAVKNKLLFCTDTLSDSLKACAIKIKKAAQNFPSVNAVQDMVDSIVAISHLSNNLKIYLLQILNEKY